VGVEVVALMPVAAFPGRWGWGYDGVHLFAVHDPYGGPAALQRFVDACHARGLAVSLDVVYNHLGPAGNYTSVFGPYFTDAHETPWGQAVNLDAEHSAEVRRWICDNALRWFRDFHVDALRLDAVHALVDDSPRHVLAQLADETAALSDGLRRPLSLVAESDLNDAVMVTPTSQGGLGMTAQWDDDVHHALHTLLTGERQGYYADFGSAEVLRTVWREAFWHAGRHSTFRGEVWGAPVPPGTSGHRFLAYAANHDQIGNRAVGDRPAATLSDGEVAGALALVLTSPFTPMLFMGEEWGARSPFRFFTDHGDPELAAAVSAGRRREFASHGWDADAIPDPQDPATRDSSVLRWDEAAEPVHAGLLTWTRDLVRLRRQERDLRDDDLATVELEAGPPDEHRTTAARTGCWCTGAPGAWWSSCARARPTCRCTVTAPSSVTGAPPPRPDGPCGCTAPAPPWCVCTTEPPHRTHPGQAVVPSDLQAASARRDMPRGWPGSPAVPLAPTAPGPYSFRRASLTPNP
jgi:maltooligosyltrehalose trehalohydrolase